MNNTKQERLQCMKKITYINGLYSNDEYIYSTLRILSVITMCIPIVSRNKHVVQLSVNRRQQLSDSESASHAS